MKPSADQAYEAFWARLSPAYPVSRGSLRLPIATKLTSLPNFVHKEIQEELKAILQKLLDTHGTKQSAETRAKNAGEDFITPLITDEYTGIVRFDCIWEPATGSVKILEINCDYPDGLLLHDSTYSVLTSTETNLHHNLFLELLNEAESVYVLHNEHAFFVDSYHAEHNKLTHHGKESFIGYDVTEIPSNATVRRCLETSKLTPKQVERLKNNNHRYINTLALRTLGYKDLLATINHSFVPKTIKLTSESVPEVTSRQSQIVLKPADGCEGYGIYFGHQMTPLEWESLTYSLLQKNYIAQELVEIPKRAVDLYDKNTVITKELYFDLCPHFFVKNGTVLGSGHTLTRYSEKQIVNVSQGGGIGYYAL